MDIYHLSRFSSATNVTMPSNCHSSPYSPSQGESRRYPSATSYSEKDNYSSSPPSSPPPSNSNNDSSSGSNDLSSRTGLASLIIAGFATVIATTGLCVAIKQLVISKAQLRQATIGTATNMPVLRVRGTGGSVGSGSRATPGGVQRAGGAISARGIEAASALGAAASSLINGAQVQLSSASTWAASVNSLAFPMPTLDFDNRSLVSLFGNPWSSPPDEGPSF
ncbi:uncharacterized protein K444DRAFT_121003 [Hyaloscypha bicolor E]|uniref:Uncharacterized protein n=1 Tax=Hyaloscypha bicolor E TaxID=1095630 RepID=A0A2J6TU69_9HELO|nr:uncharacterized protein K444DRAFT_121003 [Hyaloscypha bicolor E]PMD66560.1 hypothetical protein K444DRAFT_121003 [Hyaloscypha bicolor E]